MIECDWNTLAHFVTLERGFKTNLNKNLTWRASGHIGSRVQ
jgi:hypothetical protein